MIGRNAVSVNKMLKNLSKQPYLFKRAAQSLASQSITAKSCDFLKYALPYNRSLDHSQALQYIPNTEVTVLDSGLKVASETNSHSEIASIGVYFAAGSRFETRENNGVAHFLEHMAFKGTERRSQLELELEIENMGGQLNAYTSREITCYFARVLKKDVPKAVDILSDILQNSKLDEAAIERERDVILREMEEKENGKIAYNIQIEGMADEVLFDHLHATAFQYSPLGRTILGPAENIKSITRANLQDYIKSHYTAPRTVVVGAGAVNHDDLVKLTDANFKLPQGSTTVKELIEKEPSIFTGSDVRIREPNSSTVNFAIGFKGASWTDPDSIPLSLLQVLIGQWNKKCSIGKHMGSQLAQRLSINNLADSYMAYNTNYSDTGLFGIYVSADAHADVDQTSWAVMDELSKLAYYVDAEQLIRAKNQYKAQLLYSQDTANGVGSDIGRQMLAYDRRIPMAELFARIDAIDVETVKNVAGRFITDQDPAIAAVGFTQYIPDYNWFKRRTYKLRY